ncbi:MAG: HEPN domain-containing protein [Cyanobacteria bacterium J06627_28]
MTSEQQFLLEKAQRSLSAAEQLLQKGFYEFSVSRAYYSMFYVAEALLDKEGLSFSSHAAVISAFGRVLSKPQKVPQEFHRYLIDAQAQRTSADYDLQPDMSSEDAQKIIAQAHSFIELGVQYLKNSESL